ncbi:amidohydrolase family protein [Xylanibacter rarus]|jgi:predicted TIM-barrel fold metal-dependent hydrolase|uniref:amidohydrolase family protein n=1 Tax=Xylanibacter rarus TaxID=1676614 RepID=UPI00261E5467|nr:amidohydrolase family protein [uncultured Prevotella sp.]HJH78041.1 amidohydrolase [Prevotellaceae bacterium]
MDYKIIDAHSHLWLRQDTSWNGMPVRTLKNGRSFFLTEEVQMVPPFMIDGVNSAEVFLSNMNYAQVGGAVVVQEFIDGIQNDYLAKVKSDYPERFFVFGMCDYFKPGFYDTAASLIDSGFKGIAIPGHRLILSDGRVNLNSPEMMKMFHLMEDKGVILSLCLAENNLQNGEIKEVIEECPRLKIAIGHFGMVTAPGWEDQIKLALNDNVMIESGGITWLFNKEFYPFNGAVRAIREAIDMVGADKLMWGSDYPRTITAITYKMSYDFILKTNDLTDREKRLFLGENAEKFYGFNNLPDLPYVKNMSE